MSESAQAKVTSTFLEKKAAPKNDLTSYDQSRLEAVERQNSLLKAAIKESWTFIGYNLPLSLQLEIEQQPSQKQVEYNPKTFEYLKEVMLNAALDIMQETNMPFHVDTAVEHAKHKHQAYLQNHWTRHVLGDKANLDGKIRDLTCDGYLIRVGKGLYFYGPKLKEAVKV